MELNTFIALDLEMNQPSGKIIQVGIAIGDRLQSEEEYTTSRWLLDPDEPISPEIVALTGITDAMIADQAVTWERLAQELAELLESQALFINPVTWGAGDVPELLAAIRARGIKFPYLGRRWVDIKTHHTMRSLAVGKNPSGGLRSVMARYGLAFKGAPHRADVDALNTLRLFFRMLEQASTSAAIQTLAKNG